MKYNVYDFNDVDSLTTIPLSGRLSTESVVNAYRQLKLSQDNRFLTCIYVEANGTERLTQVLIYNLEQNIVIKRFDHNKSNSNLIDEKISYENPTFIEQDNKIIFSSKTNSKDSLLSQVFILDYNSDELTEVLEARNRISNTDYFVLNSELINVSQSHIPYTQSFNVLDLRDNRFSVYHDFGAYPGDIWPIYSYPISATTVIVSLYDPFIDQTSFTFLDLESKSISKLYFEVPLRGANININNSKDMFISYSGPVIYLHDLTKYLAETSVEANVLSGSVVYPNPSFNRSFILEVNSNINTFIDIDLVNMNGQTLTNLYENKQIFNGNNQISIEIPTEIASGQCFLIINYLEGSHNVKIQF